ncbi:MAG: NUDIX hydrolase [Anaerolineales bacterium]
MAYRVTASETLFSGRVFEVRKDRVVLEDGRESSVDVVVHPGAVALIPLDDRKQLWFVRQYRHASGGELLELPAGTLERGEPPEQCAERECQEEIGMFPGKLEHLGGFFLAPGYSTEFLEVYLATELRPDPKPRDPDEQIHVEKLSLGQVVELIGNGGLRDAKSLAALTLAGPRLGLSKR